MFVHFAKEDIKLDNLLAVGCNDTALNTEEKGGVLRRLKEKINKPVQCIVCQFYANELPLRHLVKRLDGKTSDPSKFTGSIE